MADMSKTIFGKTIVMVVAIAISAACFYGLNHFIMGIQDLPLNYDLTPAK